MKAFITGIILLCTCLAWSQSKFSRTVYFDHDEYELTAANKSQLDSLLTTLSPAFTIGLAGYCDNSGSDDYNNILSEKRVTTVKNYLLQNGVDMASITSASGYGEKDQLNDNSSNAEKQLNRRVLITMTAINDRRISSDDHLSLQQKIADSSTVAGTNITLKNIIFQGGTHNFREESSVALNELLDAMKKNPILVIEIQGYICCVNGDEDGLDVETGSYNLSLARAKAVYDYLVINGIERSRVSYKGFGHSNPIYPYPEQSEEEQIANRRVEIKIVSK
jgi:outer membrane protein OmpA-like peptidoglycan-associated protein